MDLNPPLAMEITVSEPTKTGEGFSAYIQYKVTTKSESTAFSSKENVVYRRYNDFLVLFDYLSNKYKPLGIVVVKPPEKSVSTMAKVKASSETMSDQIVELDERMYRLEVFLKDIAHHPKTCNDSEFLNFLVDQEWTSKIKFQKNKSKLARIAERVSKHWLSNINFDDFESWFGDSYNKLINLETKFASLSESARHLHQKSAAIAREIEFFSSVCTNLCFAENFSGLANVFNKLASLKEQQAHIFQEKAKCSAKYGVTTIKETHLWVLGLISIFKNAILLNNEYKNICSRLIVKNEELKQKEHVSTPRKITQYKQEIYDLDIAKADCKKELDTLLANLKYEMDLFEKVRMKHAKNSILSYFKALYELESKMKRLWEDFLPNCQLLDQPN